MFSWFDVSAPLAILAFVIAGYFVLRRQSAALDKRFGPPKP